MNLKYPQWQEPLAEVLLEFDAERFRAKLRKAEDAISKRYEELASEKHNEHELRALTDGLFLIRDVKISRFV